jgi:pimeloyl-ACP methyl ester carboxylesterase
MVPKHRRWIYRGLGVVVALLLIVALIAGFTYEQLGRDRDRSHPFRIGDPVDIGGRTINIDCAGVGNPTVIFEAGGGGYGGYGWRVAQSGVAKFTRACWYDRAGEGWSDRPISVHNSSLIANDLHMVLQQIKVNEPVVLLGHSIGGEYIRIYTATFPSDVAGLVLADSTHPDQREPAIMLSPVTRMPNSARQTLCGLLPVASRFGVIRFMLRNTRVNVPPELASHSRDAMRALRDQHVKGFETELLQGCAATRGGAIQPSSGSGNVEVDAAAARAGSMGNRPLIVLAAGQYWKLAEDPISADQIKVFHEKWIGQLQPSLARLSTNGKLITVENSGHDIPGEAPEAVVNPVKEVVNRLRAGH